MLKWILYHHALIRRYSSRLDSLSFLLLNKFKKGFLWSNFFDCRNALPINVIKINAVAMNREPEIVPAAAATMASSPRKSTCALASTG